MNSLWYIDWLKPKKLLICCKSYIFIFFIYLVLHSFSIKYNRCELKIANCKKCRYVYDVRVVFVFFFVQIFVVNQYIMIFTELNVMTTASLYYSEGNWPFSVHGFSVSQISSVSWDIVLWMDLFSDSLWHKRCWMYFITM